MNMLDHPLLRDRCTGPAALLAVSLLASSTLAQGGWHSREATLDDLPADLPAIKSLAVGDLFGEGTIDGLLMTDDGPLLAYGLGRYDHHGAITLTGTPVDIGLSSNGAGQPRTGFVLEIDATDQDFHNLHRLLRTPTGLELAPSPGSVFAHRELGASDTLRSWTGNQSLGLISTVEAANGGHRATYFITTTPDSTRFTIPAQHVGFVGGIAPSQVLIHDFYTTGDPLLIYLQGTTLRVQSLFGSLAPEPEDGPADGMVCVCAGGAGCGVLYWVGRNGAHWVGRPVTVQTSGQGSPPALQLGPENVLAPYTASMAPIRSVAHADLDDDGVPELCIAFDDRILITDPSVASPSGEWLPDITLNGASPYARSSGAEIVDVDNDGDLDLVVAYANAVGTPGQIVVHENLAAADAAPSLAQQQIAYAPAPYNLLSIAVDPSVATGWDDIEVLVFDMPLSRDESGSVLGWGRVPQFDAVAVATGILDDALVVGDKWRLDLELGPVAGITSGGTDRLLLIEMRRRKVPAGVSPEQPLLGPSTFYVADVNHGDYLFLPSEQVTWGDPVPGLQKPVEVRPDAQVPSIRIISHRPPRRGPRPNPDPAAGSD